MLKTLKKIKSIGFVVCVNIEVILLSNYTKYTVLWDTELTVTGMSDNDISTHSMCPHVSKLNNLLGNGLVFLIVGNYFTIL